MKRRVIGILTCVAVVAVLVMGCGSKANDTNDSEDSGSKSSTEATADEGEKKQYKFGFTEWASGSFFDACYDGVMSVVEEKGGEVIRIEGKTDSNIQLGVIEDFIAQGVDCVFYNPVDAEAASPALQMLIDAGIPVVNFDLAVADTDMVDAFVATDHYSAGQVAGEQILEDYPDGAEIAILDRTNDNAAALRVQGLLDTIGDNFEVVARMDGGGKPETGLAITEDILQANPDVVAIYCINDECAQGAYSAIEAAGEDIGIYSANGGPESKASILRDGEDGIWKCTAAQSPFTVGKESAEIAYKILEGEDFEKETLIPTFAINAKNIEEYAGSDWQ